MAWRDVEVASLGPQRYAPGGRRLWPGIPPGPSRDQDAWLEDAELARGKARVGGQGLETRLHHWREPPRKAGEAKPKRGSAPPG